MIQLRRSRRRGRALTALGLLVALLAPGAWAAVTTVEVNGELADPLFATAPLFDARLFVLEREGRVRVLVDGQLLATPFLDISDRVSTDGERGLLGLAFPPDFALSGALYVYYTDLQGASQVSRFYAAGNVADPDEEPILRIPQPADNHNGGTVAFGPDGFLYFASGDGGADPAEAQSRQTLLGKMLRLDVGPVFQPGSTPVAGTGYAIPGDNPFVGDPGTRSEIWSLGLRNPYRFSFDRETGDLWLADVGQSSTEEIDFEAVDSAGGLNWGWDIEEGSRCNRDVGPPAPGCGDPRLTRPVHEYAHTGGRCSITGGVRVRGTPEEWHGLYVFGDFCTGELWTLDPDTGGVVDRTAETLGTSGAFQLVGISEDGFGRLLVILRSGQVLRVEQLAECNDGVDNDGDGLVDAIEDPGCSWSGSDREAPACDDGTDNDGDGAVDLDDPHCRSASDWREADPRVSCGLGPELALMLGGLAWIRRRRAAARGIGAP